MVDEFYLTTIIKIHYLHIINLELLYFTKKLDTYKNIKTLYFLTSNI